MLGSNLDKVYNDFRFLVPFVIFDWFVAVDLVTHIIGRSSIPILVFMKRAQNRVALETVQNAR